ncbi:MAG: TonB family protein [Saprospiraceae bacterium]
MKAIIIFTISILFANFSFSQDMGNVNNNEISIEEKTPFQQTQAAMKQLRKQITKDVKYPEHLIDSGIEGTSIVEFSIDANGEITGKKITKSLGLSFDKVIMNAAKELKSIEISGTFYQGKTKIFVPVRFTK